MPGFHEMNSRQRAIMSMGHAMSTYSIMDKARERPLPHAEALRIAGESDFESLLETGWIEIVDDLVKVTDAGLEHLKKF